MLVLYRARDLLYITMCLFEITPLSLWGILVTVTRHGIFTLTDSQNCVKYS